MSAGGALRGRLGMGSVIRAVAPPALFADGRLRGAQRTAAAGYARA